MTGASQQAFLDIQPTLRKSQQMALDAVRHLGTATIDEVERHTGRDLHQRMSELHEDGWLVETGERRNGQTVYKVGEGRKNGKSLRVAQKAGQVVDAKLTPSGGLLVTTLLDDPRLLPKIGGRITLKWKP